MSTPENAGHRAHARQHDAEGVAQRYWEGMDRSMPQKLALMAGLMLLDKGAQIDFQLKAFPPYRLLGPDRGGDSLLTTGSTPLLRAAKACDVPAATLLLSRGAKVDLANSMNLTPLLVVAGSNWAITDTRGRFRNEKQCIEMAKMLLEAGAEPNPKACFARLDRVAWTGSSYSWSVG